MLFELQPILKGELIELRPLTPEDWDDLLRSLPVRPSGNSIRTAIRYEEDVFKVFFREALESGVAFVVIEISKAIELLTAL